MDDYNNLVISDIASLLLLSKTQIQENQDFIVSLELLRCYLLFVEMHFQKTSSYQILEEQYTSTLQNQNDCDMMLNCKNVEFRF